MKKLTATILSITLALTLAACGGGSSGTYTGTIPDTATTTPAPSAPSDPAQPDTGSSADGQTSGQGTDAIPDAPPDAQGDSELMFEIAPEEFNGHVFVIIHNLTKQEMAFDRIQVLRGTSQDDLSVVAEITAKSDLFHYFYMDEGAAGQGYWYMARGVRNEGGLETYGVSTYTDQIKQSEKMEWEVSSEPRWYMGDGEYFRVSLYSLDNQGLGGGASRFLNICAVFSADGAMFATFTDYYSIIYSDLSSVAMWSDTDGAEKLWDYMLCQYGTESFDYVFIVNDDSFVLGTVHKGGSHSIYTTDRTYNVID